MVISLKRISILYKYLISFIIILVVPLAILGTILYNNSVVVLQKEVEEFGISRVSNARQLIEKQLGELEKIAVKILFDKQMAPYVIKKNEYYIKLASENLMKYKNSSMLIDEIFLYFHGDSSIISSEGKMSIDTLEQYFFNFSRDEYNKLFKKLNSVKQPDTIGLANEIYSTGEGEYILYLYPDLVRDELPSTVIMFAIHKSTLIKFINNSLGELDGEFYVIKNKGDGFEEIVSLGRRLDFSELQLKDIFERTVESNITETVVNRKKYSIIKVTSQTINWQYVSIIPKVILFERVSNIRSQVYKAVLLVIIIGILVATLLSIFNYIPIKKLYKKIKDSLTQTEQQAYINEIEEIESKILYTIEKNKNLTKQINYQQILVKDQILTMLLKGEIKDVLKLSDLLTSYQIILSEGYYRVIVIFIGPLERRKATYSDISFWLDVVLQTRITNGRYYFLELMHDQIAVIVNTSDCQQSREVLINLLNEIILVFRHKLNIMISMGVGKLYNNVMNIKDSFLEALSSLDYQLIKGIGQAVLFEDILSVKNAKYWYPIEELSSMAQSLKQGNYDAFMDIIDNIVVSIKSRRLSLGMTRLVCFAIISTIINFANEINMDDFTKEIESLVQFETLDDLIKKLEDAAVKICTYVNDAKGCSNRRLKEAIIDYINKEYRSSMLSLEVVAEEFNISPGYLSRFFKEQIGFKFIDYVKNLRINEAKKLLVETQKTIKDIVEEVGYTDVANFIRTFKVMEGITPADYRKLYFQKYQN
ncbi:MAG: helix-turn-helix transcriptional regulator [Firmicutes bacterium]|nr:helix-turn-helix transcriptional regulator [Bacillota bacterium]